MQTAAALTKPASGSGLLGRIGNRDAMLALAVFVMLPNLLFVLVSPWLMVRRILGPLLYLLAGLLALVLPRMFALPLFLLAGAVDGFMIVSLAFGMPFETALSAIRFIGVLDIWTSLLYMGVAAYLLAIAVLCAVLTGRYRQRLRSASFLPAATAVLGLMWLDQAINGFVPDQPETFESAMSQAGLTSDAIIRNDRNVLMVLVEGMGAYANPQERELLEGKLRAATGNRFRLKHGTNLHYGSTSGAMSRELCGRWGTFVDYLDGKQHDCLPARLAAAGFETINYDAFESDLFALRDWYPRIGIQKMNFRSDMERDHPSAVNSLCGTTIQGLCDDDVGKLIHQQLAAPSDKRKFVYWLTLNSHLPYTPRTDDVLRCNSDRPVIAARIPCELTEIWMAVFDTVAGIAADPAMPPLDIMIVGDHNTPMWSRKAASHFIPGMVDWYYLESTGEGDKLAGK